MVLTPGKNKKHYLAGALNARTDELSYVESDHKDSYLFIDQLWTLVERDYPDASRIHLILDNYSIHCSKLTQLARDALCAMRDARCAMRPNYTALPATILSAAQSNRTRLEGSACQRHAKPHLHVHRRTLGPRQHLHRSSKPEARNDSRLNHAMLFRSLSENPVYPGYYCRNALQRVWLWMHFCIGRESSQG